MQKSQITDAGTALIITDATDAQKARILAALAEPKPVQPETLTRKQAGKIMNLHPLSLKRYDKAGLLHPIRLTPRTVRYDRQEILNLLKGATE